MNPVFSVHDKASNTYIPPFTMATKRDAIDGFKTVTNDPKTNYNKFPEDFTLCQIATFDPRTGKLEPLDVISNIIQAKDIKIEETKTPQEAEKEN